VTGGHPAFKTCATFAKGKQAHAGSSVKWLSNHGGGGGDHGDLSKTVTFRGS